MTRLKVGTPRSNVFADLAVGLIDGIVKLGIEPPSHTALEQAIADGIDRDFLRYGFALSGRVDLRKDWHLIRWLEAAYSSNIEHNDCQILPTLAEAITYVIDELDVAAIVPTRVERKDSGAIAIASKGGAVVEVSPVPLEPPNAKARARFRRTFEKVSRFGDQARGDQAMRSVPGYTGLDANSDANLKLLPEWIRDVRERPVPSGGPMVYSPKTLVMAFNAVLQKVNIKIRNAALLELTAHALGAASWNVLKAADDRTPCCKKPTHTRVTDPKSGKVTDRFYGCCWEAIAPFIGQCAAINRDYPLSPPRIQVSSMSEMISMSAITLEDRKRQIKSIGDGSLFFPDDCASLSGAELVVWVDEVPEVVKRALAHENGVASGLAEMFQIDAPIEIKHESALRRRGFKKSDVLRWRNYLLLVRHGDPHSKTLIVEDLDAVGAKRLIGAAACYKAELCRAMEDVWVLLSDYGRNAEAVFKGMSDAEAKSVSDFAGIGLQRHLFPPKTHLRSKLLAAGVEDYPALRRFRPVWSEYQKDQVDPLLRKLRADRGPDEPLIFDGYFVVTGTNAQGLTVDVDANNERWLRILDDGPLECEMPLLQFLKEAAQSMAE